MNPHKNGNQKTNSSEDKKKHDQNSESEKRRFDQNDKEFDKTKSPRTDKTEAKPNESYERT